MSFSIKVEPSGHQFQTEPDETVLDAALRQGIVLPYGCRNGACGSCVAKLVSGQIDYEDGELPPAVLPEEAAVGMVVLCQARPVSDLVIESREIKSDEAIEIRTLPCRIALMERLNHDVMLLKLKLPTTERLAFRAGQYIQILLKDGRKRSFSLANAPHDDAFLELHIRHIEGGQFTTEVFDKMHVKDLLRIEGPLGQFYLREDSDRPIILMAGGTGFAPIKGIIEHALAAGITRPMHLYWGAGAREDLYQHELAMQFAAEHAHIKYTPVLHTPKPEDNWQGATGFVHDIILRDYPDLGEYEIYAAGPPAMVYAGHDAFPAQGLDLDHYYSDAFEFQTSKT
ncbi:MAG: CDP-6-deoxy-delta-3,4-glucoseen reductase [Proteobacteria bacterium]|jgi:CDP-4-dehydro-6-deoxyglucose reductase|nr:CDP-6-deoxy-delta-3,4-glucoseen reductase [Pseudomonadota bacterium]